MAAASSSSPAPPPTKAWMMMRRQQGRRRKLHRRRQESSSFCCFGFCWTTTTLLRAGSALALCAAAVYRVVAWYGQHGSGGNSHSHSNLSLLAAMDRAHQETRTTHGSSHSNINKAAAAASARDGASSTGAALVELPPYNHSILFDRSYDYYPSTASNSNNSDASDRAAKFEQAAARLLTEFVATYTIASDDDDDDGDEPISSSGGGELLLSRRRLRQAREVVADLLSGSPGRGLARRWRHRRRKQQKPAAPALTVWIAGGSAAAGCGNARAQSYGSLLEPLLREPLLAAAAAALVDRPQTLLRVADTSMKDLTEFPSTWCLAPAAPSVVEDADVIVYDFGEERAAPHLGRMEAFLRHVLLVAASASPPQPPPLLVVRGLRTAEQWDLLQYYSNYYNAQQQQQQQRWDVLVVRDNLWPTNLVPRTTGDGDSGGAQQQQLLPIGFRSFDAFGVRASPDALHAHNLSAQQHRLVAWLLALHVVGSLLLAHGSLDDDGDSESDDGDFRRSDRRHPPSSSSTLDQENRRALPPSKYLQLEGDGLEPLRALFSETGGNRDSVHCRTSYVHSSLQTGDAGSSMELVPSANNNNNNNNTLTLTQQSLLHDIIIDGLADPDHEVADLLLPKTEQTAHRGWVLALDAASKRSKLLLRSTGDFWGFRDWKMAYYGVPQSGPLQLFVPVAGKTSGETTVSLLLVCQDDASPQRCRLHRDATFRVQGQPAVNVTLVNTDVVATVAGEPSCVQVPVDPETELLQRAKDSSVLGIHLNITVTNPRISWKNGPCSVAHIVWATRPRAKR